MDWLKEKHLPVNLRPISCDKEVPGTWRCICICICVYRSHGWLTLYPKDSKEIVAAESLSLQKYQCFTHFAGITMGDQICPFIFAVQGWLFCVKAKEHSNYCRERRKKTIGCEVGKYCLSLVYSFIDCQVHWYHYHWCRCIFQHQEQKEASVFW